jgi:nucleotide-binding universal stress UspA family protein
LSESVVVGTDGSETAHRAVLQAARLAKALGAEVHVVTARKPLQSSYATAPPEPGALVWALTPESEAEPIVTRAADAVREAGVVAHTHVHHSDPCEALIDVAERTGATTIVVGDRGMSGARRLLGSVPNRVSHAARCNVLIVSTGRPSGV